MNELYIHVTLPIDDKNITSLRQYLMTEYLEWFCVATEIEHSFGIVRLTIGIPDHTWDADLEKSLQELRQERVILAYSPIQQPDRLTDGQMTEDLLGALQGLVGEDGYLVDSCQCHDGLERMGTVCKICWARNIYTIYSSMPIFIG